MADVCPMCGHAVDPVGPVPDPPYDDAADHIKCPDCKNGRDAVNPADPCPTCEGAGWL